MAIAAEVLIPRFSYRGVFVLLASTILVALFILVRSVRPPGRESSAVAIDDPAVI